MKFGIATQDFERIILRSNLKHIIYHYAGEVFLADDSNAKSLCESSVRALKSRSSIIQETHKDPLELLQAQFKNRKEWDTKLAKNYAEHGLEYIPNDLTWFADFNSLPIQWFASLDEALKHHKEAPASRNISKSEPITGKEEVYIGEIR